MQADASSSRFSPEPLERRVRGNRLPLGQDPLRLLEHDPRVQRCLQLDRSLEQESSRIARLAVFRREQRVGAVAEQICAASSSPSLNHPSSASNSSIILVAVPLSRLRTTSVIGSPPSRLDGNVPSSAATRRRACATLGARILMSSICWPSVASGCRSAYKRRRATEAGRGLSPGATTSERPPSTLLPRRSSGENAKRRGRDLNPRRTFQHVRDFQSRSLGHSDTSPRCEAEKEGSNPRWRHSPP